MVKYALLSLGVVGLLVLGEGLVPQHPGARGQQERFVVRVPEEFPTIQAAIDAVAEGGTVLIGPGTYQENLKITKSLRLIGASQGAVIIKQLDSWGPPTIDVKNKERPIQVYLANFTVKPYGEFGIHLQASQVIVHQVTISDYPYGLAVLGGSVILSRVSVHDNGVGVWSLAGSLAVSNSVFHDNNVGIKNFIGELNVELSMFARNFVAIVMSDFGPSSGGGWVGSLSSNAITGNTVGLYLALGPSSSFQERLKAANQPESGPALISISNNEIVGNTRYGIALAHSGCLDETEQDVILYPFSLLPADQKVLIAFLGGNNKIRDNGKGDLCPPDHPWPPGFRK